MREILLFHRRCSSGDDTECVSHLLQTTGNGWTTAGNIEFPLDMSLELFQPGQRVLFNILAQFLIRVVNSAHASSLNIMEQNGSKTQFPYLQHLIIHLSWTSHGFCTLLLRRSRGAPGTEAVRNSSQLPVRDIIGAAYLGIWLLTEERRGDLFSLALGEGWRHDRCREWRSCKRFARQQTVTHVGPGDLRKQLK